MKCPCCFRIRQPDYAVRFLRKTAKPIPANTVHMISVDGSGTTEEIAYK